MRSRLLAGWALAAALGIVAGCGTTAEETATTSGLVRSSTTVPPLAVPPPESAPPATEPVTTAPAETTVPDPTTTTTMASTTLTRSEYIAAGDALCLEFVEQSNTWADPQTPEELVTLLDKGIALGDSTSASMAALEPPPEAGEVHRQLRAALDQSLVHIRNARSMLIAGDFDGAGEALDLAADVGDDSDEAAIAFGFQVCGSEERFRVG